MDSSAGRSNFANHFWPMSLALEEAYKAYKMDEVPVGSVIVSRDGKICGMAHNLKEKVFDPCGHAELLSLQRAAKEMKSWRLEGCVLYVTLEPCLMCLGAMIQARLKMLVFGAYDLKGGALSLNYNFHQDSRLNHRLSVIGGIRHFESSKILSDFFREKRSSYKRP